MKTIEIYGTGVHNLGAMLMAEAIAERLRDADRETRLAVGAGFGDATARGRLDFDLVDDVPGRAAGPYLRMAPASLRRILGLVRTKTVGVVLDASGYAYADTFGTKPAQYLLTRMAQKARREQKLILMPQAYGPFEDPKVAEACLALFKRADLMFARDPQSQQAANALLGRDKALLSPDFTVGLPPGPTNEFDLPTSYVAFVPNFRMLNGQDDPEGAAYTALVPELLKATQSTGLGVVIVLHSRQEDVALAHRIAEAVPGSVIVTHENPRTLKTVLGGAQLVIGSRFHALVSALSQGVPCVGLGWAHKYAWLFKDFGIAEFLVNVDDPGKAHARLDMLLDPQTRSVQRDSLLGVAQAIKSQNAQMWARVICEIGKGGKDVRAAE